MRTKKIVTNEDYERSDCYRCGRSDGVMCWFNKYKPVPISVTSVRHDRCGYYVKEAM